MNNISKAQSILSLYSNPKPHFSLIDDELIWHDERAEPTEADIKTEIARLQAAEPIRLLRIDRDRLLASSDWTGLSDVDMTNEKLAEWKLYRQKLRDLPTGLTTEDKVKNAVWPTKP